MTTESEDVNAQDIEDKDIEDKAIEDILNSPIHHSQKGSKPSSANSGQNIYPVLPDGDNQTNGECNRF